MFGRHLFADLLGLPALLDICGLYIGIEVEVLGRQRIREVLLDATIRSTSLDLRDRTHISDGRNDVVRVINISQWGGPHRTFRGGLLTEILLELP
jgi:hypothetical protein